MNTKSVTQLLGAAAALLVTADALSAAEGLPSGTTGSVPQYRTYETRIVNKKPYENRFRDVVLDAEFTAPSGKKTKFWGFYDGDGKGGQEGDVWKLRFLPTEVGTYRYTYAWSDGTPGGQGMFACVSEGAGKGILRAYASNPRWLSWNGADPVMLRSYYVGRLTHTDLPWSIQNVYQPLLERGYNQVQFIGSLYGYDDKGLRDAPSGRAPNAGRGYNVNLAGWRNAESHFQWLNDHDITVHHWTGLGIGRKDEWQNWSADEKEFHIRYILSRLAPMANQCWGYWWEVQAPDDFLELLDRYDPWDHLRGGQNVKDEISFAQPKYTWMNQSEGSTLFTPEQFHARALALWDRLSPKMPLVMNETLMWHSNPKQGEVSDVTLRRLAWAATTAGASFVWNWAGTETTKEWAYASKMFESSADEWLDILYDAFDNEVEMGPLVPADQLLSDSSSGPTWVMSGGGQYLVFAQDGGSFTLDVDKGEYQQIWIDARAGKKQAGSLKASGGPMRFTAPDTASDWALVLRQPRRAKTTVGLIGQSILHYPNKGKAQNNLFDFLSRWGNGHYDLKFATESGAGMHSAIPGAMEVAKAGSDFFIPCEGTAYPLEKGGETRTLANMGRYVEAARKSGSVPVMFMPYAHRSWYGDPRYLPESRDGKLLGGPDNIIPEGIKTYKRIAEKLDIEYIPVMEAHVIAHERLRGRDLDAYYADNVHMTPDGHFLNACVTHAVLMKLRPEEIEFEGDAAGLALKDESIQIARETIRRYQEQRGSAALAKEPEAKHAFVHPGIAHSRAELDFIKAKVKAGEQPWRSGWEELRAWEGASLSWQTRPFAIVERGAYAKPNIGGGELQDAASAAYAHALQWHITGNEAHAKKAVEIMNAWAGTLKEIKGSDQKLLAGMSGHIWANAAEIVKHTFDGWREQDQARFRSMLLGVYWPLMEGFRPGYNGNWDASMINSIMAIGVFCDDREKFDYAVDYFHNGRGKGALGNYVYPSGQCQETTRDQNHTQMGLGYLANACEIGYHQGLDLWGALENRLAKGFEYSARVQLKLPVPVEGKLGERGIGRLAPIYEQVYNHYHHRRGMEMPHTKGVLLKGRPEGFNRSFLSWGTLTHAEVGEPEKAERPGKDGAAPPAWCARRPPSRGCFAPETRGWRCA